MKAGSSSLDRALAGRRVIVCVGSGGVGKTTVAAALGIAAAATGRRVMVCTIDPARRLANALGLAEFGNEEVRVDSDRLSQAGLSVSGELWATMLDLKRSWDTFVLQNAPPEKQQAILQNRYYQTLSTALAGSQEYIALERLHDLHTRGDFDLVILDTPPTSHALDFLEAPGRVLDFLGNDAARTLLSPLLSAGRFSLRLLSRGGGLLTGTLAKVAGLSTLQELAAFLSETESFYGVFQQRAGEVRTLLGSQQAGFVIVSSASPLTVDEALDLQARLRQEHMPVVAMVANRVELDPLGDLPDPSLQALADALARQGLAGTGEPALPERLLATALDLRGLAIAERPSLTRLAGTGVELHVVPRFEGDLHDLSGLRRIRDALLPSHTGAGLQGEDPGRVG